MTERTITINGEVNYPGIYKYADNETLEDFVLQAGGLKETASTVKVDVARRVSNPKALTTDSIIAQTYSFALKDGFVVDGEPGFVLQPFDEVYVRRSPAYSEQQNVVVDGRVKPEVTAPGCYIVSALSAYDASGTKQVAFTARQDDQTWEYGYMQGTSMSAPFVTGVVATWLEANPQLTHEAAPDLPRVSRDVRFTFEAGRSPALQNR